MKFFLLLFTLFFSATATSFAIITEAVGEADIINADITSAKLVATSRAKWLAIEKVAGITVRVDTIINNTKLADEAVKTELSGTIKSLKVLDEGKDGNIYWVKISADITPIEAKKTLTTLAKNTSIIVFMPLITPDGKREFNQPFADAIIKELKLKGFEVSGIGSYKDENIRKVLDKALSTDNYELLRPLTEKTLSPTILVGSLNIVAKGNDAGYGSIGELVGGEVEWRLIGDQNSKKVLIASGTERGKGQGNTVNDAAYNLTKSMSKSTAIKVASEVSEAVLGGNYKTIKVRLRGERNPTQQTELREDVKNTPFVLNIREDGLDSLLIDYPEKIYYFAAFITRTNKYEVMKIDGNEIILERR